MKKIVYATLAAATLFATIGAASAQTTLNQASLNTGGASWGYNLNMQSLDNIK